MRTSTWAALLLVPMHASAQCTATLCELEARFPAESPFKAAALTAREALALEDRVTVLERSRAPGNVASLGAADIGAAAPLAGVYAGDVLHLRDGARVADRLIARTVKAGRNVRQPARAAEPDPQTVQSTWRVELPPPSGADVQLTADARRALDPGRYARVALAGEAVLELRTGIYYFDELVTAAGTKVEIDNEDGTVVVHVLRELAHGGAFAFTHDASDVLTTYFGTRDVVIRGEFDGSLMAPWATVIVNDVVAEHDGMFYGRRLLAKAGAVVRKQTVSGRGAAIRSMRARVALIAAGDGGFQLAAPNPEIAVFADTPVGRLLNQHFSLMYGYGPDAQTRYEASLAELRAHAPEAIRSLVAVYGNEPESIDTQQRRWSLVAMLADLGHDQALAPLRAIAYSPVNAAITAIQGDHHFRPMQYEDMIRMRAVDGIGRIASAGNSAATGTLFDLVMNGPESTRRYAAVHYLAGGNREERLATLRANLPPERQYLTRLETDINKVPQPPRPEARAPAQP